MGARAAQRSMMMGKGWGTRRRRARADVGRRARDARIGTNETTFSTTVSLASGASASRARGASTEAGGGGEAADGDEDAGDPSVDEYVLEFDGASRGNPGVAGAGALLRRKRDDRIVEELLEYLGPERTVNERVRGAVFGIEKGGGARYTEDRGAWGQ